MIGETVKVRVDFGADLSDSMAMTIKSCSIWGVGTSPLEIITNGVVMPLLTHMVQLIETASNRINEFLWQVFTLGNGSRVTLSCDMKLIKAVEETTTTTTTVAPTTTTATTSTTTSTTTTTTTTKTCSTGWSRYTIGGQIKCLKYNGYDALQNAQSRCADVGASVPLPRNANENYEYRAAFSEFVGSGLDVALGASDVATEGNQHYAYLSTADGDWFDWSATYNVAIVCEK